MVPIIVRMHTPEQLEHQRWLKEITAIPTAAGHEGRVIAWIRSWVRKRKNLKLSQDEAGNLVLTQAASTAKARGTKANDKTVKPLFITAHLDHPAFVVHEIVDEKTIELEFRGGVNDPYFENAKIEIFDSRDGIHPAKVMKLDSKAKPFKRVTAKLVEATNAIAPGDIGRWVFEKNGCDPHMNGGLLYTPACDDLAAVAAALAVMDILRGKPECAHVGALFTRAEEVGFIGAIAAARGKTVPKDARLICLENSRSYAESPIGDGPIVRVGDKSSVFEPNLTNQISMLMAEHHKAHPEFKWQRKLMPGGTCEATTFSAYGYQSTCICLPLGNYHNMTCIDAVLAGRRPAKVAPEFIATGDFHGLIEMLVVCAQKLDSMDVPTIRKRMEELWKKNKGVLDSKPSEVKPQRAQGKELVSR